MMRFFVNRLLAISRGQLANSKSSFVLLRICHLPALIVYLLLMALSACNDEKKEDHSQHQQPQTINQLYTCPMPQDSFFSDKPGQCPKCGMDLIGVEQDNHSQHRQPVTSNEKEPESKKLKGISLETLLKPANQYVIASLPLVTAKYSEEPVEVDVLGYTAYNTSSVGTIAARINGRIEKLYVKYRYQKISKGQKIMDIYSPELVTAQQNLLFLLKSDADNTGMIESAKQKLLLLGFSGHQLQQVIKSGTPSMIVTVYSNYSGHIHESANMTKMSGVATTAEETMNTATQTTPELSLKEGMYVQKGQAVFSVYDAGRLWILLNIYPQDQFFVKRGDKVRVIPETKPDKDFIATISYIEPFFRRGSKTTAARVNYDNSLLQLPVGSQVRATILSGVHKGLWLPKEAVLSLGMDKVVFLKTDEGFKVHRIQTGHVYKKLLQITGGLNETDSVMANAQYLVDSEGFVKTSGSQSP